MSSAYILNVAMALANSSAMMMPRAGLHLGRMHRAWYYKKRANIRGRR